MLCKAFCNDDELKAFWCDEGVEGEGLIVPVVRTVSGVAARKQEEVF